MACARSQSHCDLRRIAAQNRLRLSAQISQIALNVALPINEMQHAVGERSDQTRIIEGDATFARRRAAQALKVRQPPLVENHPQIESLKLQPVEDDFAAQPERERIADGDRERGAINRGDDLVGLPVEKLHVAKRDRAQTASRLEAADLGAQAVLFESLFKLGYDETIEPFGAQVKKREQDGDDDECEQAER